MSEPIADSEDALPPPVPVDVGPEAATPGEQGRSERAGRRTDDDRGRMFPCEQCGADLEFSIGQQRLACPYCGFARELAASVAEAVEIRERDLAAALLAQSEVRRSKAGASPGLREVRCDACGSTVVFEGTLSSTDCAFCGSPVQERSAHEAEDRLPVDGVLAFRIDRDGARSALKRWVDSRWLAPNDFKRRGVKGRFTGVYLPYWTFDSHADVAFSGQRGDHYWVTVGSGKNKRRVRKTRWRSVSGRFETFFDDVLVVASLGVKRELVRDLEPWPLDACLPFTREVLAGHQARTYDVSLEEGWSRGRTRMDEAIEGMVRRRIGGDVQRIHSIRTVHDPVTYKHLLLPVWLLGYLYRMRLYQVTVNAVTGEVRGERPWSWVKITLLGLGAAAAVGIFLVVKDGLFG